MNRYSYFGTLILLVALLVSFQYLPQRDRTGQVLGEFEEQWPRYSRTLPVEPVPGGGPWFLTGAQFISNNTFLVQFENGHIGHVAVVRRNGGNFQDLGVFKDSLTFDRELYGDIVTYFGDPNFAARTYVSNGPGRLVKTANNIFLR